MAVAIMGIAVVAVLGLVTTSILMSDIHRKQTTAGANLRNYAEAIETYVAAGNFDASASPNYSPLTVSFVVPSGYAATVDTQCLSAAAATATCSASSAVQRLALTLTSADSRVAETLTLIVRKP